MQAHAERRPEVHTRDVPGDNPTTNDSGASRSGGKVTIQDRDHPADAGRNHNILLLPSAEARDESDPHMSRFRHEVLEMA
jgi:hypothetical protein